MLLTDGSLVTVDDLLKKEARVQTEATATSIDLNQKLADTIEAVQIEIQASAQLASNIYWNPNRIIGRYLYGDYTNTRIRNETIVVTDPLKRWLVYRCLELFFQDAQARKVQDQTYQRKWEMYRALAVASRILTYARGLGFVIAPLPRPLAVALSTGAGGSQGARTYDVAVTWVDSSGNQSAPSVTQSQVVAASNLLTINISALSPPAGQSVGQGDTPFIYGVATGWNVYAVLTGGTPVLQTSAAIAIATKTWTEPGTGLLTTTAAVGTGQVPDGFRNLHQVMMRG